MKTKQFWDLMVEISDLWLDIKDRDWKLLAFFNVKWTESLWEFLNLHKSK